MGRIITIVCIVILVVGCFWWWHNSHTPNPYDGAVRREAAMETGATTMENGRNLGEVHPTPSRSDAPGTINGDPYHPDRDDAASQNTRAQDDPYTPAGPYPPDRDRRKRGPGTEYPQPSRFGHPEDSAHTQLANDSQPPANPNGERFGGDGVYQWYRQGDLTYRINTRSGQSCIIYATLEEWRKPFVYRHGCQAR